MFFIEHNYFGLNIKMFDKSKNKSYRFFFFFWLKIDNIFLEKKIKYKKYIFLRKELQKFSRVFEIKFVMGDVFKLPLDFFI